MITDVNVTEQQIHNHYFVAANCVTPANSSHITAAAAQGMARGGIDRANRGIQRHQPGIPCGNFADSAPSSLNSACYFGGSIAQFAFFAFS